LFDSSVATLTVSPNTKEGEYSVILKSTLNNKIKGTIIKLIVTSSPVAADALTAN